MKNTLLSGTLASLFSAIALAACGKKELDDPWAPLNGPSQWIWGRHAKYRNGFTLRHTVVGYAIHHGAAFLWAAVYERLRRKSRDNASLRPAIASSALAAFVDYRLTPERFTPGFQHRLSRTSLVLVYATFALGLAAAGTLSHRAFRGKRSAHAG